MSYPKFADPIDGSHMAAKLSSRTEIYTTAISLAQHLENNYKDLEGGEWVTGDRWTQHIFEILRTFCQKEFGLDPDTECFHRGHPSGKGEFLWDFIASRTDTGILIAAESEQQADKKNEVEALKHDFDKLLYVFAPIRVLICKSKNRAHSSKLLAELTQYGNGSCRSFNPGAVFIVHFCLWENEGSHSYVWQSAGDPTEVSLEMLDFSPV